MKTITIALALFTLCLPALSHAETITCNRGDMTISLDGDFRSQGWYLVTVEEDGVALYFRDAFRKWTGGLDHDCYHGVCTYVFNTRNRSVTFRMNRTTDGFLGLNGRFVTSSARFEGNGIRLTMNDSQRNVNWFFEQCEQVP